MSDLKWKNSFVNQFFLKRNGLLLTRNLKKPKIAAYNRTLKKAKRKLCKNPPRIYFLIKNLGKVFIRPWKSLLSKPSESSAKTQHPYIFLSKSSEKFSYVLENLYFPSQAKVLQGPSTSIISYRKPRNPLFLSLINLKKLIYF